MTLATHNRDIDEMEIVFIKGKVEIDHPGGARQVMSPAYIKGLKEGVISDWLRLGEQIATYESWELAIK